MMASKAQAVAADQDISDGLAEIELQKLQRQYRIMEGDRKAYSEESRIIISKQRTSIEKLKRDNQNLQNELRLLETRNDDRRRNGIQSKKAEFMSDQAESFQRKIKQILSEILGLDNEIANVDRDIDQFRALLGGVNAGMQNSDSIEKQIRVLENRLDKALIKFNKSLAVNKRLRATIDNLRRERLVFDNIYRKFEKELMEQKKQMAEIIEMSNAAYEARDEAQARIIALREKAEKEHQAYVQEMKELDRALEQDRRLKDFMATKAADRMDNMDGAQKKQLNNKETFANKFPSQDALTESLETYEKAFAEIRKVTGTNDIGELVQRFKAVEDHNFSLFNYVNEVNNEIEKMAEEIVSIQTRTDSLRVGNVAAEEERKRTISKLEESLNTSKEKAKVYEDQYLHTTQLLDDLRKGIERVMTLFSQTVLPSSSTSKSKVKRNKTGITKTELKADSGENPSADATAEEGVAADTIEGEEVVSEGTPAEPKADAEAASVAGAEGEEVALGSETESAEEAGEKKPSDLSTAASSLVGAHGVTDTNLLSCLALIEHGTNEFLTMHYTVNSPKKSGASTVSEDKPDGAKDVPLLVSAGGVGNLLGQGPMMPITSLTIIAPSTGDDHESDDNASEEDDRPMTREELKQKTLKGLMKMEKIAAVPGGNTNKTGKKRKL